VVNDALMKVRRRKSAPAVFLDSQEEREDGARPLEIADLTPDPEQALHHSQLRLHLLRAIEQLKPAFRAVFVLRDVQGMSILETAEALDISVPLVKTRLLRARLKLRRWLSAFFGESYVIPRAGFSSAKVITMAQR
jgi:RNA polymerase sigma-70 factor (ECF subfamily)